MELTIFKLAIKAIITNKSRSFLTMLGVIIGVSSVVLLTAIGTGLQAYVTEQFESLGSNNILIFPGEVFNEQGGFDQEAQQNAIANNKLKITDVDEIARLREYIDAVVPMNSQSDTVSFQKESDTYSIIGTSYEYKQALGYDLAKGRWFNKVEDQSSARVAVLGHTVAEEIFGQVDPIGKKIHIGAQTFEVVGQVDEIGGFGGGGPSFDKYVYIPIETAFKVYDTEMVIEIIAQAKNKDQIPEAIKAIEQVMRKRLDEDEFSVFDQSDILKTINQILSVLTMGLGGIAAISLLVGGIGIMNIMLVSVTERTSEIGLRKALGATPRQILLQFLVEAALLSVLGGLIGLGLAYLGSLAIQPYFPAKVTLGAVLLAFGVSTAVGLIFGAAPARNAAKLSPIEALRYE